MGTFRMLVHSIGPLCEEEIGDGMKPLCKEQTGDIMGWLREEGVG
jgi:hypothetical protein